MLLLLFCDESFLAVATIISN